MSDNRLGIALVITQMMADPNCEADLRDIQNKVAILTPFWAKVHNRQVVIRTFTPTTDGWKKFDNVNKFQFLMHARVYEWLHWTPSLTDGSVCEWTVYDIRRPDPVLEYEGLYIFYANAEPYGVQFLSNGTTYTVLHRNQDSYTQATLEIVHSIIEECVENAD